MATTNVGVWDVERSSLSSMSWTSIIANSNTKWINGQPNSTERNYAGDWGYFWMGVWGASLRPDYHNNSTYAVFCYEISSGDNSAFSGLSSSYFTVKTRTTDTKEELKLLANIDDPEPSSNILDVPPGVAANSDRRTGNAITYLNNNDYADRGLIIPLKYNDNSDSITLTHALFYAPNWSSGYNSNIYYAPKSRKFSVQQIIPGIPNLSATPSDFEYTYDGTEQNHTISLTLLNQDYPLSNGWSDVKIWIGTNQSTYSGDDGIQDYVPSSTTSEGTLDIDIRTTGREHVCDLTYYYRITDDKAYLGSEGADEITGSFTFKIIKADPTFNPPTGKNLSYSGVQQNLINLGSLTGITNTKSDIDGVKCKLEYSLDQTTWTTTSPKAKDPGTYTIYYRVVGNGDIKDSAIGSVTSKIIGTTVTVKVYLPNIAGLRVYSQSGAITWAGATYDNNSVWTKVFDYEGTLDFPNIQSYVNSQVFSFDDNTFDYPNGYLMVGYSGFESKQTSSVDLTTMNYHEGKSYILNKDLHLYPRLKWIKASTYKGNFDNQAHKATLTPQTAYTDVNEFRAAASGIKIQADTANKNEPNAPTGTTIKTNSSTAGTAVDIATNYIDAGIYRIGITLTETADGETFTKTGHTTNNYINIKKAPRNIQLNPATLTMQVNRMATSIVTGWDDLDNSAPTANVLSASARATVTPNTISMGNTINIRSMMSVGTVNINVTIPETDNYLAETTPVVVTITGQGNGIWWYDGTQWIITQPYVWNGSAWSEDFI